MLRSRLYKNDSSITGDCPSVYDTDGPDLIVQGAEVDPETARRLIEPRSGERAVLIHRDTVSTALHRLAHPATNREVEPYSPEWYRLFEDRTTMFRLELLQHYSAPGEAEALHRFLAGGSIFDIDSAGWWAGVLRGIRARGGIAQRVHVVAEPLSDYLRFELAGYTHSIVGGEDIRILPADMAADLDLPGHDYLLFDSRDLAVMRYDSGGVLVATEVVDDPAAIVRHAYWRDLTLAAAIPYRPYMAQRRKEELAPNHVPT